MSNPQKQQTWALSTQQCCSRRAPGLVPNVCWHSRSPPKCLLPVVFTKAPLKREQNQEMASSSAWGDLPHTEVPKTACQNPRCRGRPSFSLESLRVA